MTDHALGVGVQAVIRPVFNLDQTRATRARSASPRSSTGPGADLARAPRGARV